MYKFLGEGISISKVHGQPRQVNWNGKEVIVLPMYHPAAALRAGEVMKQFLEDFKKLPTLLKGGNEIARVEVKLETTTPTKAKAEEEQLKLI